MMQIVMAVQVEADDHCECEMFFDDVGGGVQADSEWFSGGQAESMVHIDRCIYVRTYMVVMAGLVLY